jgi:hypothetical protein
MYDIHHLIIEKLNKVDGKLSDEYPQKCIPHYARELKSRFRDEIVTSFLDSPSHSR